MRRFRPLAVLAATALSLGCATRGSGGHHHDATIHHRFDDVEQWVKVFDDPARDAWQKPSTVVEFLGLRPGGRVADLGAGTGYFTVPLALAVGETGKVFAIDIEPGLVEHLEERARSAGLSQVAAVLAAPDDPKLSGSSVDLIFVCDTWHHIDDRLAYLPKLAHALAAGGRLAILDFQEGELPVGPPAGHKLSREAVEAELTGAGWKLAAELRELPYQYLLVFEPPN